MAKIIAQSLNENRRLYDQVINAEWLINLEDELDIESIKINGVEFSSVLTSTNIIAQFIELLEENEEHDEEELPTEAVLACIQRYYSIDPELNQVIEKCRKHFIEMRKEEGADDVKAEFAQERADEFFESLEDNLPAKKIAFIQAYFDLDKFTNDLFMNDYDAVRIEHNGYNNFYIFSSH